ncbi:NAD(P)H-quinone oxidoreductase [Bradyrhizobium symbiodeficiens]|uniref:NAD(P)H-quinone oxidoreductase n=2 Tax=Bradyrhizobium symbiodeficiens TaxID=1404367 RepID=UPI000BA1BB41|nr:NAD(P)H-quinone oxidoreductase [Bradyrhizobium symbiodeficiens]AWM07089.1 NAD(P)H-quinone oxidoreductase [Bradyrhizobium symbiodeficiens]QIP00088.1 NAD(P)H-quinone oxidoreductase [Bradyrhizobium symbiodeficiens]
MKGVVFDSFGPAEVLRLAEVPRPEVRPQDLLLRVMAAGVNRADILQRNGAYGSQSFGESNLLGLELAGEVVGVGSEVDDVSIGERMMAIVGGGAYAEFARVDRRMAVRLPGNVSFVEGAAIMESFVTAVEAVSHLARVAHGQTVLVHGAAGGVGSACVQVARALGATVYATANASRLADVGKIGAAAVIDYRADDFESAVARLTDHRGVDAVIDFVGGDYLPRNLRSLRPGGTLVQVGILSGQQVASIPLNLLLHNHLRLVGTVMKSRSLDEKRAMVRRFSEDFLPLLVSGTLKPLVDQVFPLEHAVDAHRSVERGGGFGKVVLAVD